jgi:hypothetical protein
LLFTIGNSAAPSPPAPHPAQRRSRAPRTVPGTVAPGAPIPPPRPSRRNLRGSGTGAGATPPQDRRSGSVDPSSPSTDTPVAPEDRGRRGRSRAAVAGNYFQCFLGGIMFKLYID